MEFWDIDRDFQDRCLVVMFFYIILVYYFFLKKDKLFFTYQTIDISSILFQRHVRADIMLQETLIVLQSTILSRNRGLSIGGRESDICWNFKKHIPNKPYLNWNENSFVSFWIFKRETHISSCDKRNINVFFFLKRCYKF